jgi:phosphopantetheinyl transferase
VIIQRRHNCDLLFTASADRGLHVDVWMPLIAEINSWPLSHCELHKAANGQPYFMIGGKRHFCSISHANGLTIVAHHANHLIGVDGELIDQKRTDLDLLTTYFPNVPTELPPQSDNDLFLCHWTQAEARLKALGVGFLDQQWNARSENVGRSISWIEEHNSQRWRISQICLE